MSSPDPLNRGEPVLSARDPLDASSDVYVLRKDAEGREYPYVLTFRELGEFFAQDIKLWDSISWQQRLKNQRDNDPNYKPILPGSGLRARRRWRG
jgi:hypothetical protein